MTLRSDQAWSIRLRPTEARDLPFVLAAEGAPEAREHVEQWSEEEHRTALEADHTAHFVIEWTDGEPVGFAILEGLTRPERACLLRRLVVARPGEGYGARAMEALQRHCFEQLGCRRLWLEVREDNSAARALYEGQGLREEERKTFVQMGVTEDEYRRRAEEREEA